MNRMALCILALCCLLGCSKSPEVKKITAWKTYEDPYFKLSFSYPADWPIDTETGRISIYSSPDVVNRFYDFSAEGPDGVRLTVSIEKEDTVMTEDQLVDRIRRELASAGFEVQGTQATQMGGNPASEIRYSGSIDSRNKIFGVQAVASKDSMQFNVKFDAFNRMFESYKNVYDNVLTSLHVPEPHAAAKEADPSIPSATFEAFENQYLAISYPDNFEVLIQHAKEPSVFSMDIKGYRQDSYLHIDVIPTKGLSAEKVVEQNAKFYREKSRGEATVAGIRTVYLNYSPMKEIESRVYFLVKNDRFYRVIFNYPTSMKETFLPPFEKSVGSIRAK